MRFLPRFQPGVPSRRRYGGFVLEEKARGHSVKPEAFWDLIDPVVDHADTGPGIELFSRRERPGWDAFGNQVVPLGEDGA